MARLVVIADDLTGANDTGLQFLKAGLRTVVALSGDAPDADVLVVNTQSRALPAEQAGQLAAAAGRRHAGLMIYKKMDSTARGHWGVELSAIMAATSTRLALLTPAFPAQGRTVRHGRVLLGGVPVEQTALAHDTTFPVREGYLPALLAGQGVSQVVPVGLELLQAGADALASYLMNAAGVVVCDAETEAHLQTIARAAALLQPTPLVCGSAGLAAALPAAFGWASHIVPTRPTAVGPTLVVAGSRNPVTQRQCQTARAAGIATWEVSPSALADAPAGADFCRPVGDHLGCGHDAVVAIDAGEASLAGRSEHIAAHLALTAHDIIVRGRAGAVVLTGGDIAGAFCQRAGVTAIRLADEILSGIPAGLLMGGDLDGLPVATKAGGFGAPDAFVRIVSYFRRGSQT